MKADALADQTVKNNLALAMHESTSSDTTKKPRLSKTAIDMVSGSAAGIVGTFISHPLDTVKVRYQVSRSDNITLRKCISDIYRYGGVSN